MEKMGEKVVENGRKMGGELRHLDLVEKWDVEMKGSRVESSDAFLAQQVFKGPVLVAFVLHLQPRGEIQERVCHCGGSHAATSTREEVGKRVGHF